VRKDVREAGAKLLFLPTAPISPNEQVFTKLKTLRRKAAERAGATTWKRIGSVLNEFKYRFTSFRISL
jgi:transposase